MRDLNPLLFVKLGAVPPTILATIALMAELESSGQKEGEPETNCVDIENLVMNKILTDGDEGPKAAQEWLKTNPPQLASWLDGVTTFDGKPGLDAVKKSLGL